MGHLKTHTKEKSQGAFENSEGRKSKQVFMIDRTINIDYDVTNVTITSKGQEIYEYKDD